MPIKTSTRVIRVPRRLPNVRDGGRWPQQNVRPTGRHRRQRCSVCSNRLRLDTLRRQWHQNDAAGSVKNAQVAANAEKNSPINPSSFAAASVMWVRDRPSSPAALTAVMDCCSSVVAQHGHGIAFVRFRCPVLHLAGDPQARSGETITS